MAIDGTMLTAINTIAVAKKTWDSGKNRRNDPTTGLCGDTFERGNHLFS